MGLNLNVSKLPMNILEYLENILGFNKIAPEKKIAKKASLSYAKTQTKKLVSHPLNDFSL